MLTDIIFAISAWELFIGFENRYQFETPVLTCLMLWHFKEIIFFFFFELIGTFSIFQDFLEWNTAANTLSIWQKENWHMSIVY